MGKNISASELQDQMISDVENLIVRASSRNDDLARRVTDTLTNTWVNLQFGPALRDTGISAYTDDDGGNAETVAA